MITFWSDEFDRLNQVLRDLMGSPAQNLLREIEQHRQMLEPPGYRALRELQGSVEAELRHVSESLTSGLTSVLGQYEMVRSLASAQYPNALVTDLQRSLQTFRPPALPLIESFADQVRRASQNLDSFRQFERTFAGQLFEVASGVAEAPEEELDERVGHLTEFLGSQISKARHGPISLEGWVQIVLALILFVHSMMATQQSEERVMKRLDNIRARLTSIAPADKAAQTPDLRLVSAAVLRLRAEPSTESRILGKLTRNSLVRVMSKDRSWAQIEYFDFAAGRTREAWVAHRFLRALPENFQQTEAKAQAARERFERHFGEVDLGRPTGVDNAQIDTDLGREYAETHKE